MDRAHVSQIIEWDKNKRLNFDPAYQRLGGVWGSKDKEELIVTILNGLPTPELFMHHRLKDNGEFVYDVVDGKQRLQTILDFVNNGFKSRVTLGESDDKKSFNELGAAEISKFYNYEIRFFKLEDLDLQILSEIFVRINRTGRKLTKQEIRNAMFKGDFIKLAKSLCARGQTKDYLIVRGIVTDATKKRMGDIELVCELLAYIKKGVQDKKKTLNDIIGENETLPRKREVKKKFVRILNIIDKLLPNLKETRFKHKSDFYSLFGALYDLDDANYNIENEDKQKFVGRILVDFSNAVDGREVVQGSTGIQFDIKTYYETTQEGTDTKNNRQIRINYIKQLVASIFGKKDEQRLFSQAQKRLLWNSDDDKLCALCSKKIDSWDDLDIDHKALWAAGGLTELKNGQLTHKICNRKKNKVANISSATMSEPKPL